MNGFPSESTLKYYRTIYPPGTRIQLDEMNDPQAIPVGTKGEILGIDDAGNALMKWDNGRSLSLAIEVDKFHELQLENNRKLIGQAVDGNRNLRSIEDVADFIIYHGQYGDVEIVTEYHTPFMKTKGIYISSIVMSFRKFLLQCKRRSKCRIQALTMRFRRKKLIWIYRKYNMKG